MEIVEKFMQDKRDARQCHNTLVTDRTDSRVLFFVLAVSKNYESIALECM